MSGCYEKALIESRQTEFFVVASQRVLSSVSDIELELAGASIKPSTSVKNLGVTFDG